MQYGGEDLDAFTRRIYGAVQNIATHADGDTILVVSHGMAIRRFLTALSTPDQPISSFIGNCGIVQLHYEDGTFTVEQIINPNA